MKNSISSYRKDQNLTQSDLANQVGVRRETISRIEKNLYNPSLLLAEKIANALHTTIYEIFTFEADDYKKQE